ncbi:MAG TPA: glutaredoxin [Phaeodactylibacter sp.]|nr:glutaredoxin [Phaeodactylibacter sp.]
MKVNNREILIYYNPKSSSDRKTIAHAQGLSPHIKAFSHRQSPSTGTSWHMILHSLDVHPKELLNKAHPYYQKNLRGREFEKEDWLMVIANNPELIKAPIAVRGNRAVLCNNPTDIYKLTKPHTVS